jgi:hypothetical protein
VAAAPPLPAHLARLPGGTWAAWRPVCLRGAGFPASHVLRLAAPQSSRLADLLIEEEARARRSSVEEARNALAAAADEAQRRRLRRVLRRLGNGPCPAPLAAIPRDDATGAPGSVEDLRAQLERAFAAEELEISVRVQDLARDPTLREAVLWQNRHAVRTALDPLLKRAPGVGSRNERRPKELLLASYLQRYCVKNDSIGFFGPVGWGRIVDHGPVVRLETGPALLARRRVYFEAWCVDALARKLTSLDGVRTWVTPRLLPHLYLDGRQLRISGSEAVELDAPHARLLACCDGRRDAMAIAKALVADRSAGFDRVKDVLDLLELSLRSGLIGWTLEGPLELHPEHRLRARLEAVGEERARHACLSALGELEGARSAVAAAAGDAPALDRALEGLETTFTRLTDVGSTRKHGETYASRTLVYEDCRRDVKLEIGAGFLARLGPPISLGLQVGRWAMREMARRYRAEFERAYREVSASTGQAAVDVALITPRIPALAGDPEQKYVITSDVQAEVQRRWARILELPEGEREVHYRSAVLRPKVEEVFAATDPGWAWPRYVSPDVMIAAADAAAIARGEGQIVVGEVHLLNSLAQSALVNQHPDPAELREAMEQDHLPPCVAKVLGKDDTGQRTNVGVRRRQDYRLDDTPEGSDGEPSRWLKPGELLMERGASGLEVRTVDGRARFEVIDFMGHTLSYSRRVTKLNPLSLPPRAHTPRVVVDGVVLWRERWELPAEQLAFAAQTDPVERFVEARRWARARGMPRFMFFKVPIEMKPCYVDLDSPLYIDLLSKLARNTVRSGDPGAVSFTEMLPRIEQSWLVDAEGRHYTSELRIAALEAGPKEPGTGAA